MRSIPLVLVFACIGCGSNNDSTTPGESSDVEGTWVDIKSSGAALKLKFDKGNFESSNYGTLTDGKLIVDMDSGSYSVAGHTITVHLSASTCVGVQTVETTRSMDFTREGDSLTVTLGTTAYLFHSGTLTGFSSAVIGCVKDDNTFVEHPITKISN